MEIKGAKIDFKTIIKYMSYFIIMILLSVARTQNGIAPFHLGFFVALIYCRQSVVALSPLYLIALVIASPTIESVIIGIVPPIMFTSLKCVHLLLSKPIKMLHVNIYALLSQLPLILLNIKNISELINAVVTIIIAQVFTYCCVIICYALLVRGRKYKYTTDEKVGLFILIGAIALGLYKIDIMGFRPYFVIIPLLIFATAYISSPLNAICLALSCGLGAGIMSANIAIGGCITLCACICVIFARNNIYLAGGGYLIADIFCGMYFGGFGKYDYLHIIAVLIGLSLFLLLPKQTRENLVASLSKDGAYTVRNMITRNRKEVSSRLLNISKVFAEMGDLLSGGITTQLSNTEIIKGITREVTAEICNNCNNYLNCSRLLGGDSKQAVGDLVEIGLEKKSVGLTDLTSFLRSRCVCINELLSAINLKYTAYKLKEQDNEQISAGRLLLGEQMKGLGEMLSQLSSNMLKEISFDSEREKRIIEELCYHNIVCNEILVAGEGEFSTVTLVVRKSDADKRALLGIVNAIMRCEYVCSNIKDLEIKGFVSVHLSVAPKYSVLYGISTQIMDGSLACGDTYSIERMSDGKFMIALCDGMGSGHNAHYNSCATISMIENFYKAGFDNNIVLSLINKLLSTYNDENFTCLDMCIIDTNNGKADFIKLGGVQGLLRREGQIIKIESGALPLGIVEEATPYTERRILQNNDTLIFMSDGILDSIGYQGVSDILLSDTAKNPQALSDRILYESTKNGTEDDSTVIAVRIINNQTKK